VSRHPFLEHRVAGLLALDAEPRPACPRCGDQQPQLAGRRAGPFGLLLPRYWCVRCACHYSRVTGTPLARLHLPREKFEKLLDSLGLPRSVRDVATEIGVGPAATARLVRSLRMWLLELDPEGAEERMVRLGGAVLSPRKPAVPPSLLPGDAALASTLQHAVDELRSTFHLPVPERCPSCGSPRARLHTRANAYIPHPTYRCGDCSLLFTRLTGTPLARSRWPDKQRLFIEYLGIPLQLTEVAELLEVDFATVRNWRKRYADLAEQLDPSGALADRIRLAPALAGEPCGYCGHTDTLTWDDVRRWHCTGCGRFFSRRLGPK
jgi:transposase-like protein